MSWNPAEAERKARKDGTWFGEQPEHEEEPCYCAETSTRNCPRHGQGEHEEARRLAEHDLDWLREMEETFRQATPSPSLTAFLTCATKLRHAYALLSKAEQERDENMDALVDQAKKTELFAQSQGLMWKRANRAERELERLREAICAEAHHFPPNAVAGTSCYCGKAAW